MRRKLNSPAGTLSFLNRIQKELDTTDRWERFVSLYPAWLKSCMPVKASALVLIAPQSGSFQLLHCSSPELRHWIDLQIEDGIIQWAAAHPRPFFLEEPTLQPVLRGLPVVFVPVKQDGRPFALVVIEPQKGFRSLNPDVEALLQVLGPYIGKGINKFFPTQAVNATTTTDSRNLVAKSALLGRLMPFLLHELTNPMTTIQGRIGLMMYSGTQSNSILPNLEVVNQQADRIATLIRVFNRLSNGELHNTSTRELSLNDLLNELNPILDAISQRNGISIVRQIPDESRFVGEPGLVKLLILNAVVTLSEFAGTNKNLCISYSRLDSEATITFFFDKDQNGKKADWSATRTSLAELRLLARKAAIDSYVPNEGLGVGFRVAL